MIKEKKLQPERKINEEAQRNFELMKVPEIVIQEERGAQIFSLLLKAEDPTWGETETPLAQETADYLENHPLDPEILKTISEMQKRGVDEETLYNLALTYQQPERAKHVMDMAAEYKPHVKDPQEEYQKVIALLESIDKYFSASPLAEKFATKIEADKEKRLQGLAETRKMVAKIVDFFAPNIKTSNIKKVVFVPTDPLYRKNAGRAFSSFPGEHIIISHIENILNQIHEFCHGLINPIVKKLGERLSDEQKMNISRLASKELKNDYGEDYFSLLCEEFVRTYELIEQDHKPRTSTDFQRAISDMSEDDFQKTLRTEPRFKKRLAELNISALGDFKKNYEKYFLKFGLNTLREIIFEFYQEYISRPDQTINFEQFTLEKFPAFLDKKS